jgi:hypothetical protein
MFPVATSGPRYLFDLIMPRLIEMGVIGGDMRGECTHGSMTTVGDDMRRAPSTMCTALCAQVGVHMRVRSCVRMPPAHSQLYTVYLS